MPENVPNKTSFGQLVETFKKLRGPGGCPWDKEQTHQSLKPYALEEIYEFLEAVDENNDQEMKTELGDVLLQVMLHSQIAHDRKAFNIYDVIDTLNEKMIRRHPHVFSHTQVSNADEVIENWDEIKRKEKPSAEKNDDPFAGIPKNLPALQRSSKIGKKSIRYNFDWSDVSYVLEKVDEELAELREAIAEKQSQEDIALELGDILFTLAQVGRKLEIDPEQALRATNAKFEKRFKLMRKLCNEDGHDFSELEIHQLEAYWIKAKKTLRGEI